MLTCVTLPPFKTHFAHPSTSNQCMKNGDDVILHSIFAIPLSYDVGLSVLGSLDVSLVLPMM